MGQNEMDPLEDSLDRLLQACSNAGIDASTVFSQSAEDVIAFAHASRIAPLELLAICAVLIERLEAIERELLNVDDSKLH